MARPLGLLACLLLPAALAFRPPPALPSSAAAATRRRPLLETTPPRTARYWARKAPRLLPLRARLDDEGGNGHNSNGGPDTSSSSSSSGGGGKIDYRRPKALKDPPPQLMRAMASSSSSSSAQQQQQGQEQAAPGELAVLAETLRLLFCRAFVDPVLNPPRIEVYPLLIGDLSVLLSFRSLEDTLTTPLPTLDIAASPDIIARGLMLYADPLHAAAHIYSVIADGMGLGLFWMAAVLWGGAEAVDMGTARSYTLSTLNVFKCWLALCNVRLVVLFLQALSAGEGIDLPHFQMELSALLLTMLCWRWLNVAVLKRFTG